eukprot:GEMP01013414.1.p1 GENE.GEMP01013414.1~~GEMP01013414.1.p1  ORF type:complete len:537 (+),score=95.48 GEMP01013414.1:143-1612(+)
MVLLTLLALTSASAMKDSAMKDVLVLGGTGMRGRPLVDSLVGVANITLVQRGHIYWDSHEALLNKTQDAVQSIQCDRVKRPLSACKQIKTRSSKKKWDVCIDFFPRKEKEMEDTLDALSDKCTHYIFVSSHLVYGASGQKPKEGWYREDDATVVDKKLVLDVERKKASAAKAYQLNYLKAERYLVENADFPYTIIRPADMIGIKETRVRAWFLFLWAKAHHDINLPLIWTEHEENTEFSLLSNIELAHGIQLVMNKVLKNTCCAKDVQNEIFNFAFEETITQKMLNIGLVNGHGSQNIAQSSVNQTAGIYPDRFLFAKLNVKKAQRVLKWSPRGLGIHIEDAIKFYERVMFSDKYAKTRDMMLQLAVEEKGTDAISGKLMTWCRSHYQIGVTHKKHDPNALDFDEDHETQNEPRARKWKAHGDKKSAKGKQKETGEKKTVKDKLKKTGAKKVVKDEPKKTVLEKTATDDTDETRKADSQGGEKEKDGEL